MISCVGLSHDGVGDDGLRFMVIVGCGVIGCELSAADVGRARRSAGTGDGAGDEEHIVAVVWWEIGAAEMGCARHSAGKWGYPTLIVHGVMGSSHAGPLSRVVDIGDKLL